MEFTKFVAKFKNLVVAIKAMLARISPLRSAPRNLRSEAAALNLCSDRLDARAFKISSPKFTLLIWIKFMWLRLGAKGLCDACAA